MGLIKKLLLPLTVVIISIPYLRAYTNSDPYDVLGVKNDADMDQVKRAYREVARKVHPDKSNLSESEAAKKFDELSKALKAIEEARYKKTPSMKSDEKPSLLYRIFKRLIDHISLMMKILLPTSTESTMTLMILFSGAIIAGSLYWLKKQAGTSRSTSSSQSEIDRFKLDSLDDHNTQPTANYTQLKIIELKLETYNGMVKLLKPGQRSIILLCDSATRGPLVNQFKKAVWPYRRNKSLLFGHLCLDKNLNWYKAIIQEILGVESLVINKRNCIGTVLSLNGFKRYFRLYHAKYRERNYALSQDEDGSFLGFNDDDEEDEVGRTCKTAEEGLMGEPWNGPLHDTCNVDNLLDQLPQWLERMFDGQTKRYFLAEWPDEMI